MPKSRRKKDKGEHEIFDSIRKPTAPAGIKFGHEKPMEKQMPSLRKAKHKKSNDPDTDK